MPTITLDEIRQSLDRKYGPTVIELGEGRSCVLRSPIRLPKADRRALRELQERLNKLQEDDGDADAAGADVEDELVDGLREIFRVAAEDKASAEEFLAAAGDDLGFLREVLELWQESTEPGEASPSPS